MRQQQTFLLLPHLLKGVSDLWFCVHVALVPYRMPLYPYKLSPGETLKYGGERW
jgi:hypothetical protein